MTSCGLWPSRGRLIAVVVDDDGRALPTVAAALNDDARWGLLERLVAHGLDGGLIIPEDLVRVDSIGQLALTHGIAVWVAPRRLIDAIRAAAALATGPPARTAAMVARLALLPAWRGHLRRLGSQPDRRQLPLL